jgi:hypothetical protein
MRTAITVEISADGKASFSGPSGYAEAAELFRSYKETGLPANVARLELWASDTGRVKSIVNKNQPEN